MGGGGGYLGEPQARGHFTDKCIETGSAPALTRTHTNRSRQTLNQTQEDTGGYARMQAFPHTDTHMHMQRTPAGCQAQRRPLQAAISM